MTDTPSSTDLSPEAARAYRDAMRQFEQQMAAVDTDTRSIARHTTWIIRTVSGLTLLTALYLGYTVFILGGDAKRLAGGMVEMYHHLGTMTADVEGMRASMVNMAPPIHGMPAMAEDVRAIGNHLTRINDSVGGIDHALDGVDRQVTAIGGDVQRMNGEMMRMTRGVDFMRYDVGEMARPVP
ncbi:hypothetical protein [Endothiovibrio diazotrophicus]